MNTATSTLLPASASVDVRRIPPRERHALIFATFADLGLGQAMELVNDHDPLPLYEHFQLRHENGFDWEYLEQGPAVWRVRIGKVDRPKARGSCCGGCGCG